MDTAGTGQQVPAVGGAGVDVPEEQLPLGLEAVVELPVVRHPLPLVAEALGGGEVGVPDRLGGGGAVLDAALAQPRDGRALRAVDLELHQFVAVDADRPGGVDLRDRTAVQLEDAVGGVVGGGGVGLAVLVPAPRHVGRGQRLDGGDAAEQLVQHVLPVREHVDDDAAAVLGAVVPGGTLGLLPVALEDPIAELAAHGQDPPEEAPVDQPLQLQQARQEELVLDDAVPHSLLPGQAGEREGAVETGGGGLLGVDVLPGGDRLPDRLLAGGGDLGVEVDVDVRVGEHRVQVGGDMLQAVPLGDLPQRVLAAAEQDRLGPQHGAVAEVEAALVAQGEDRPEQVLAVAHAPGHAVHGDAHRRRACHVGPLPGPLLCRCVPCRLRDKRHSKRFPAGRKLASGRRSAQDRGRAAGLVPLAAGTRHGPLTWPFTRPYDELRDRRTTR
ncbi:hypothetical protein SGPA1_30274 [Streptomyces misionensis JCM 4497]